MITVEDKEEIRRLFYLDHKGIRCIARMLGHSRKTVRRALADASVPVYQRKEPQPSPKMDPFAAQIDQWLADDLNNPTKQHLTAHRIYQLLQEQPGFAAAESTVRRFVRARHQKIRPPQVFIPLAYDPGVDAQCDFGEAVFVLNEERVNAMLFCLRLCYSKQPFVMAFPHQRQEAFFEGHVAAFRFFHGVPQRIWYDNLKTAVQRVLTGRDRQEQSAFVGLRSHYLFESRFCSPHAGHEKGLIENLVGYARRNFMVPLPQVSSWDELNQHLLACCRAEGQRQLRGAQTTIGARWAEEQAHFLPLPDWPYSCCTVHPVRANGFGLVSFETNRYSVPPEHAHGDLLLKAYTWRIEIAVKDQVVATHVRGYDREQDILDPMHYLPLLLLKPGAFEHAKAIQTWRAHWPAVYDQYRQALLQRWGMSQGTREFVQVLQLHRDHPAELVCQAVEQALQLGAYSADAVCNLVLQLAQPTPRVVPLDLAAQPALAAIPGAAAEVSHFNRLLTAPGG
jgi:transposase